MQLELKYKFFFRMEITLVLTVQTFRHQYRTALPCGPKCPTLWSEVSRPNFVDSYHVFLTFFSNKECHVYNLLSRNLHHLISEYDYFKEDSFTSIDSQSVRP